MDYAIDGKKGVIRDNVTGDRCIIITKSRLTQIITRLTEIFQSGAQVIITEACKSAGERYVAEVGEEKSKDTTQFIQTAVQRFTDAGLGRIELLEFKPDTSELSFRIWDNFFAEIHDGRPTYCNCVDAFLSGVYKQLLHKSPKIEETRCIGRSDPYCEWHLTL